MPADQSPDHPVSDHRSPTTLIIPGLAGSPEGHWQYLWAEERANARYVQQDSFDLPQLNAWKRNLQQALEQAGEAFLVAHSLGCILVANMLDRPALSRIRGALLVAPCDLDATGAIHPGLIDFGAMPDAPLPFQSLLVSSRDDPYMHVDRARHFATAWGSQLVDLGYAGHINLSSGFGRFRKGYQLLDGLVEKVSASGETGVSTVRAVRPAPAHAAGSAAAG